MKSDSQKFWKEGERNSEREWVSKRWERALFYDTVVSDKNTQIISSRQTNTVGLSQTGLTWNLTWMCRRINLYKSSHGSHFSPPRVSNCLEKTVCRKKAISLQAWNSLSVLFLLTRQIFDGHAVWFCKDCFHYKSGDISIESLVLELQFFETIFDLPPCTSLGWFNVFCLVGRPEEPVLSTRKVSHQNNAQLLVSSCQKKTMTCWTAMKQNGPQERTARLVADRTTQTQTRPALIQVPWKTTVSPAQWKPSLRASCRTSTKKPRSCALDTNISGSCLKIFDNDFCESA